MNVVSRLSFAFSLLASVRSNEVKLTLLLLIYVALPSQAVPLDAVTLQIHLYQPPSSSHVTEFSTNPQNDEDGDSDVPAASVLELPSLSLEGVWDTLIYEGEVKEKLLGYIYSTMLFSDASVDFNIVTWNR